MNILQDFAFKIEKYIYYMLLLTVAVIPLQQELASGCMNLTFAAALLVAFYKGRSQEKVLNTWEQWVLYMLLAIAVFSLNFSGDKFMSAWNLVYVAGQYGGMIFVLMRYGWQDRKHLVLYRENDVTLKSNLAYNWVREQSWANSLLGHYLQKYFRLPRPLQLIGAFLTVAVLVSGIGVAQKFLGVVADSIWSDPDEFPELKIRVYSTLVNPNILGGYLVLVIAYCSAFFHVLKQHRLTRWGCLALGLLAALCLLYTYSRGNWLACGFSLLIFALFYCHKAIIPIVGAGAAAVVIGGQAVVHRLASITSGEDTSAALRLAYLEGTQAMIEEHPWGVGWFGYRFAFPDYNFYLDDKNVIMYHCHNMFLNVWAELGYPGFLCFLTILVIFIYNAARLSCRGKTPWLQAMGTGYVLAASGLIIGGLTDHIYFNTQMGMLFWFLGILILVCRKMNANNEYL